MAVCKYPQCASPATETWAMVELCKHHHKIIKDETDKYYNGKPSERRNNEIRMNYTMIAHLIPWSKLNME